MRTENILGLNDQKTIFQKAHLSLRINTIIQHYLINQVNVSAVTIYTRLFGTRLIGTRPIGTRLIGTVKIDRVQLEHVSLACNQCVYVQCKVAQRDCNITIAHKSSIGQ